MPRAVGVVVLLVSCVRQPAMVSAPRVEGARIVREKVRLRCSGEKARAQCLAEADYWLDEVTSELSVVSMRAEQVTIEQRAKRVHVRARLAPPPVRRFDLSMPAPLVRHRAVSSALGYQACMFDEGGCRFEVDYLMARDRADAHDAEVNVSTPSGWKVKQRVDDESRILTTLASGTAGFAAGGPFLGVGPRFFEGKVLGAGRVGWELFAPHWLAHGFALDADVSGRVTGAFTEEVASPALLMLPAVGVGVGLPIELYPHTAAGLRLQLSVQLPYVGVLAVFDVFPSRLDPLMQSVFLQTSF